MLEVSGEVMVETTVVADTGNTGDELLCVSGNVSGNTAGAGVSLLDVCDEVMVATTAAVDTGDIGNGLPCVSGNVSGLPIGAGDSLSGNALVGKWGVGDTGSLWESDGTLKTGSCLLDVRGNTFLLDDSTEEGEGDFLLDASEDTVTAAGDVSGDATEAGE